LLKVVGQLAKRLVELTRAMAAVTVAITSIQMLPVVAVQVGIPATVVTAL
jgi:hypothetical protein